ncbi:MAG: hypothetical protein GC203_12690 [Phenylobacterium sp.]|uniref:hypothetical protein n=1 Tax=Phenylobacterium sp. TaxID=1871053 RepID=UPI0025CCD042|nr:hypothetical protein [Phenylobacterium sp.]MBI1198712.1 hypothetical protein [Phenylobacterium sp.]
MSAAPGLSTPWTASFPALVAAAKGRHPIELLADLQGEQSLSAQRLAGEAGAVPLFTPPLPQGEGLALPHPLDAEWRFCAETARGLVRRAVAVTRPGDKVLLLGVPTVILAAAESAADRRFCVAYEDNIIGVGLAARLGEDPRFQDPVAADCAAAIVDPPWYPPVFAGLLGMAATGCSQDAAIFVGTPPLGVRPTSETERAELLATADQLGLSLVDQASESLTYRTPAFEAAAMQAAGVHLWLPTWRRGDLLVFRRGEIRVGPPLPTAPPAFELTLHGVRLRLLAQPAPAPDGIVPLVNGEVFPSVSTRVSGRAQANLWTSGNRAFSCPPAATLTALQLLAAEHDLWPKGLDPARTETRDSTPIDPIHLVAELARIAARDLAHSATLVGGSSWDRTANDARFLNGSATMFRRTLAGAAG